MFFFPFGTDAPVYHWPKATVALIVLTTIAFFMTIGMDGEKVVPYALAFGDGIHPVQWVTSLFLHAGYQHLIGNLVFLWVFGLVVEGKVGSLWFLLLYFGMGAGESAFSQVVHLRSEASSAIGASAAIYGLMAICLIWAPKNDLHCFYFIMAGYRIFTNTIDIPIMLFGVLYIGIEAVIVAITKASVSSALFHSTGAVLGLIAGVLMLKMKLVDCENWDIFAVMQGRQGRTKDQDAKLRTRIAPRPEERSPRKPKSKKKANADSMDDPAEAATRRFRLALHNEGADQAFVAYNRAVRTVAGWHPNEHDWLELIKVLVAEKQWRPSITVMEDYLRRCADPSPRVRLTLAQVLVREPQRPAHALRVLEPIPEAALPDALKKQRRSIVRKAEAMIEEGVYELEGENW